MTELAPYAASEAQSRGRRYEEPAAAYRTEYQRDRVSQSMSRLSVLAESKRSPSPTAAMANAPEP